MALPSRKKIATIIFIVFIVGFVGAIGWYVAPVLFQASSEEEPTDEPRDVNLFPFIGGGLFGQNEEKENPEDTQPLSEEDRSRARMPRLRQISPGPVIGAILAPADDHGGVVGFAPTTTTDEDIHNTIRYIELGTGHVYQGSTLKEEITRISNTTVPRINEAHFADLDNILIRYINNQDVIKTFQAELVNNFGDNDATPQRLQGIFLEDNIIAIDTSPDSEVMMVVADPLGAKFIVSDLARENVRQVHDSPLSEWRVSFDGSTSDVVVLSTPSYNTFGVAYTLDLANGSFIPFVYARKALDVVSSRDRNHVLLSLQDSEGMQLYLWNEASNEYTLMPQPTFAEKCVWADTRALFYCAVPTDPIIYLEPDLWYQGVTEYRDQIWQINPANGQMSLLLSPIEYTQESLDMIDIDISRDEQFLYFRDKQTRSLWSVQIDYDTINQVVPETIPPVPTENLPRSNKEDTDPSNQEPGESFFE